MTSLRHFIEFYYLELRKTLSAVKMHTLSTIIILFLLGTILNTVLIFILSLVLLIRFNKLRLMYITFLLIGLFYISSFNNKMSAEYNKIHSLQNFSGSIIEPPIERNFNKEIITNIDNLRGNAIITIQNQTNLEITDQLQFSANLELVKNNDRFAEEYKDFLISKNIHYYVQNAKVKYTKKSNNPTLTALSAARNNLLNVSHSYLNSSKADSLNSIILGAKNNLDKDFKVKLQSSGLSHIVSASGYNIMILYSYLQTLRGRIPAKLLRLFSFISISFSVLIIGIYILPIQRAFIMISLLILAEEFGRKSSPLNSLTVSTLFIVLQYPLYINNISLQLSIAATIGIFFINPIFTKNFRINGSNKLKSYLYETLLMTFSVILCTAPIIILSFGSLNLTGLVSNIFILPLIPIFTILTAFGIFFNFIHLGILSFVIFFFIDFLIYIFNYFVILFSKINLSISGEYRSLLFLSLLIFFLLIYIYKSSFNKRYEHLKSRDKL
jgi:competence protein ComEC